jgi:hypothetical protein
MADECFAEMETLYPQELRAGKLLQAQFYINEITYRENEQAHKEDSRISRRDFWLELLVIVLILLELIVSIEAIRLGIKDASKQAEILGHMDTSTALTAAAAKEQATQLAQLTEQQKQSLDALQHMNDELQGSLRKTGEMAEATRQQLKILQDEEVRRQAELAKKPKLELYAGDVSVTGSTVIPKFPTQQQQNATKSVVDFSLRNLGNAAATNGTLRIIVFNRDVILECRSPFERLHEDPENIPAGHAILVPFSRVRPGSALPMSVTATYRAGEWPFTIFFNVDADEIPVGTPLGSLTITPPKP